MKRDNKIKWSNRMLLEIKIRIKCKTKILCKANNQNNMQIRPLALNPTFKIKIKCNLLHNSQVNLAKHNKTNSTVNKCSNQAANPANSTSRQLIPTLCNSPSLISHSSHRCNRFNSQYNRCNRLFRVANPLRILHKIRWGIWVHQGRCSSRCTIIQMP